MVKVITYNDIHLSIDPIYLNVAALFIVNTRYTVLTEKSISVMNSKFFGLKCLCAIFCIAMKTFL